MLQPAYLPEGALAECYMDLDLCSSLKEEKSHVSLFPQTEKEEAWEECEQAAELCSLPSTSGCHTTAPSPHHCLVCSQEVWSSSRWAGRLQDELVMKKERVRRPCLESGFKKRSRDCRIHRISLYHWGFQITGILSQSRVSSTAINDLQCRKANIQVLCRPYSPAFHVYTFEHPFTSVFASTLCIWHILSCLHPQIHNPPLAGWGARDISLPRWCSWEDVCSGGCKKLQASSLCFDRLCWRILLWLEPDMVLADAMQASHAALAVPLRSDPGPLPLPDPPPLSPLSPGQRLSWVERALPARLRGGSLMWTDGTRGAGYICSLNSSTFAIVCKWVSASGGWETMGLGSKCSFPVTCSKVNLCCVIKFDTDEENTCWCKQLASLPAEAQILCRTTAFFSPVWKGPSGEACLGVAFHSFTASGCLFLRFSTDLIPVSISHYVYVTGFQKALALISLQVLVTDRCK